MDTESDGPVRAENPGVDLLSKVLGLPMPEAPIAIRKESEAVKQSESSSAKGLTIWKPLERMT